MAFFDIKNPLSFENFQKLWRLVYMTDMSLQCHVSIDYWPLLKKVNILLPNTTNKTNHTKIKTTFVI